MAMVYQIENLAVLLKDGLHELARRHWEAADNTGEEYDPDWSRYQEMENCNILRWLAVRQDGKLVGYASMLVTPHLHSRKINRGVIQDYFIAPEYRSGFAGVRLFREIHKIMRAVNANLVLASDRGGLGKFFKFLGYFKGETIWVKKFTAEGV